MLFNEINENEPVYNYCSSLNDVCEKAKFEIQYLSGFPIKTNILPDRKMQPEIKSIILFMYKQDGFIKSAEKLDLKKIFNN